MGRASVAVRGNMKKELSIQELEAQGEKGSVYVINTSPRGSRGDVLFSAPKKNGNGSDVVRITKTWIPQDLTDQVTKAQLLESSEFRKTVRKGLIKLVTADYAELILTQSDAQEEAQRIANLRSAAQQILRSTPVTDTDEEEEPKSPVAKRRKENIAKQEQEAQGITIGDSAFDVFLTSLQGKSETEMMNALKNEGSFTRKELKKIQAVYGEVPRVSKFIAKKLQAE